MEPVEKGSPFPAILLVVAVLSVGVALVVSVSIWDPVKPAVAKGTKVTKIATEPATPDFQLGEIVNVKDDCGALILSATTEIGATDVRLTRARDKEGQRELIYSELVYTTGITSRVRIIGFDADPDKTRRLGCDVTWIQVRVIDDDGNGDDDGDGGGLAGWVNIEHLER